MSRKWANSGFDWQFAAAGLMGLRFASINEDPSLRLDASIAGQVVVAPTIT